MTLSKAIFLLFFLFYSTQVFSSQTNVSTTHIEKKDKPFTLEFVITSQMNKNQRKRHKIDGVISKFDTSLLYSLTENDELRLFASTMFKLIEDNQNPVTIDLVEGMYRRKNIFTEKSNGFDMDLELKSYYLTDRVAAKRYSFNGAFIPQLVFSKNLTSSLSLSAKIRHNFYYRSNGNDSTAKGETRLYLTPTYMFSHKLFLNAMFTFRHYMRVGKSHHRPEVSDRLRFTPSIMAVVSKNVLVEGYLESYLMESHDGHLFSPDLLKSTTIGVSAYITAFNF
ncbi:MAG: hypothetical protein ISR65_03950 [Bacteriovoracaceae bacterium]|nr:hypothetical protein [Bacteriovoracaceae bacterium]